MGALYSEADLRAGGLRFNIKSSISMTGGDTRVTVDYSEGAASGEAKVMASVRQDGDPIH
jgi:hypothetical protein